MPRKKKVVEEKKELTLQEQINLQNREPNFRGKDGKLYLVRCYLCEPKYGRENYLPIVATGQCAWCGWKETPDKEE